MSNSTGTPLDTNAFIDVISKNELALKSWFQRKRYHMESHGKLRDRLKHKYGLGRKYVDDLSEEQMNYLYYLLDPYKPSYEPFMDRLARAKGHDSLKIVLEYIESKIDSLM
jgi:hypothetical protein